MTRRPDPKPERGESHSVLSIVGFPLLFVLIIALLVIFRKNLWEIFSSPEQLRDWVSARGIAAPLLFIGLQILQVVIFVIPGEVPQIAAGYLFGFWLGALYTVIGIAAGSAVNFRLARWLGVPFVRRLFRKESIEKVNRISTTSHAQIGFFLLFLIPGIPKDVLCYVAGLSPMGFLYFMAVSSIGRLPGIVGSTYIGSAAAERRWIVVIGLSAAALLLFLGGFFFKERISDMIIRITRRRGKSDDG